MNIREIMQARFRDQITDDEAIAALIKAGESPGAARALLRQQDELLAEDVIDEEGIDSGTEAGAK